MMIRVAAVTLCMSLAASAPVAEVVGWRTDGSGRYPDAKPVTEWSPEKNVVWKTKMPSWSNATPVIAGERLFVCSEPDRLICVALADGRILWEKANPVFDTLPAAEAERVKAEMAAKSIEAKYKERRRLEGQLGRARRELRKKPKDEEVRKRINDLGAQIAELKKAVAPYEKFIKPPAHNVNGCTSMTPVTDGKHVWVLFGTGVTACYDTEGTRRWIAYVERPRQGYGTSASPVLAGGKVMLHVNDMTALDAATGKEAWKCSGLRHSWGTSLVTKLGGDEVLVTPGGDMVRVSDGKRIARRVSRLEYNAPLIDDGKIYYIQHGGGCFRVPADAGDSVKPEKIWGCTPKKDRYYSSPVMHDGLIYAIMRNRIMSVIDAKTGQVVYEQQLSGKLGRGQAYSSITLGGDHIFVSSDDGTTLVLRPGRTYEEVARNKLESFRSSPVLRGSRMYVRGRGHLWCIGK